AIEACKSAAATSNLEDFLKADIEFHQTLVKSAHNQMLYELYDYITDPLVSSIRNLMISDAHFDYEKEIHNDLFDSIKHENLEKKLPRFRRISFAKEYISRSDRNEFVK